MVTFFEDFLEKNVNNQEYQDGDEEVAICDELLAYRDFISKGNYSFMTHYRQIILNLAVEDRAQEQEEYLKEKLIEFTTEQIDEDIIKEVSARVN